MSMQRDLNAPLTEARERHYRNSTHEEIKNLLIERNKLMDDVILLKFLISKGEDTNGHAPEFVQQASPAEIILFTKRTKVA